MGADLKNDGSLLGIGGDSSTSFNNSNAIHFDDFNGDGTTDIISTNRPDHPDWLMLTLIKDKFKQYSIQGFSEFNLAGNINKMNPCDIKGDGKMDIIFRGKGQNSENSTNKINVAINKGNGYEYRLTEYTSPVTFDYTSGNNYQYFW